MMRELGYGAEYRYEPSFAHPVHQEWLSEAARYAIRSAGAASRKEAATR